MKIRSSMILSNLQSLIMFKFAITNCFLLQYTSSATPARCYVLVCQCFPSDSPVFSQCLTSVLPVFCQCFTSVLLVFHQYFASVSPVFYQRFSNDSRVFSKVCQSCLFALKLSQLPEH